ncbi:MAG TPA: PQQ-dependent sugar dehydrogenase [Candidatus Binatia bacterium]|nr:PQQ-dependent sugar dehydrogenase [Candidatus Binatia bacterium]
MKTRAAFSPVLAGTRSFLLLEGASKAALVTLLIGLASSGAQVAAAATLPAGFIEENIPGQWNEAVGLTFEPEQQTPGGRMYVWERGGRVWIVENGVKLTPPLIDLSEEVGGWRDFGLLGFAFHPNFRQNGYVYLAYTVDHHYLTKFGTPEYNPATNEYFMATIHRITRYTARASDGFRSVDPASRKVLVGESITNGFPSLYQSHGIGSLVFGTDGTLLASCGDGASYSSIDVGSASETYFAQALAEGIIRPKENFGAFRAQLVDSLSGKILRIDPDSGDGIASNPFYDPANPRSARSRVWSLGLRNPYRMTLRPGTGSHLRSEANPGVLYIGDVGLATFEDLNVATGPGLNFGWPIFEGLEPHPKYRTSNATNLDTPNPLFGTGGCTQRYFYFRNLLVQDSLRPPSWPNPCNTNVQVPADLLRFVHTRPVIDWKHETGPARTGIYTTNGAAAVTNIGGPGSPVSGPQFGGTSSIGGTWYQGDDFPAIYKNTYFHGDYEGQWIRNFVFDTNNKPVAVRDFLSNGGGIVCIATHPVDGSLYYVTWTNGIKRIGYVGAGNQPPKAVATASKTYGPSPLTVQFDGSASSDPEGHPLTYAWNFGDASMVSTQATPSHTFLAPAGAPTSYTVTLIVTDNSNATAQATLLISANNTPPTVTITSPTNGMRYPLTSETTYTLSANVSDAEHGPSQLTCEWQTILHHNNHIHADPVDTNCATSTVISPLGCDGETYYYSIILQVTDAAGLTTAQEVQLYPDCPEQPAVLKYLGRDEAGAIRWQLTGDPTRSYRVEHSTNLVAWSTVTTIQPVAGLAEFDDPSAGALPFRFYRAVLLP